ncbi:MAG: GNAT family N-acetyltransferase [Hyphomicrobiaceae bacterium]|nr:MAG: GNAT family N-acetyltransferase [Hyphomicrobiaceae bacterium]
MASAERPNRIQRLGHMPPAKSTSDPATVSHRNAEPEKSMTRPNEQAPAEIAIRTSLAPGDVGMIVHLHGVIYAREYGLDHTFEPYVARPLSDFVLAGSGAGRIWIAESGNRMLGSIAIVRSGDEAQLRWFLLVPEARGKGLGGRLLREALGYCRAEGFASVYLWTFDELAEALALYRKHGFSVTERNTSPRWGRERTELKMELKLA